MADCAVSDELDGVTLHVPEYNKAIGTLLRFGFHIQHLPDGRREA